MKTKEFIVHASEEEKGELEMVQEQADIGVVGLGVMGRNLAYNIADHGYSVVGLDRDDSKVEALTEDTDNDNVFGATSVEAFLTHLKRPRAILALVPAGGPVNSVVEQFKEHLDEGDVIIDGGNSHFTDTNRHAQELSELGIHFLGVGVSGGSEGARRGPSMMPGGPKEAYKRVASIFEAVAAKVDGDPCVTYLGPGSAGHYVKMVHNGIEYAIMELIAEVYDLLKRAGGLSNEEIAELFDKWNDSALSSFLVEITSRIFLTRDDETNQSLIDVILDAARQKGTGKWTSQDAMELQIPVPTIDAAVSMRDLSGLKEEREAAAKVLPPLNLDSKIDSTELVEQLHDALHFAMIVAYAQGMSLLRAASDSYDYDLKLADVARIWRGGCIIRARMLDDIRKVFDDDPTTANLMCEKPFSEILQQKRSAIRDIIGTATGNGIPVAGLASALAYYDGYRTFRLPANLIQAQRDYFGSHTYERIDQEGSFHNDWS